MKIWQYLQNLTVVVFILLFLSSCASGPSVESERDTSVVSEQTEGQQQRARIRLQLAVGYYEQHQISTALDEVKQSLQADPNYADAHSMRGLIYMEMGENGMAEDSFLQAIKLSPNNPDFNNNYGWFLCQNGQEQKSISYFERALKVRAYQSPAKALNNAGVCSLKLKDKSNAEKYFLRAFQYDPGNASTNANLAKIFYDRQDYERARFYITRVTKTNMANAEALWLAIKVEHKIGDRSTESGLAAQLRNRYPDSTEYAAYERGAFDE